MSSWVRKFTKPVSGAVGSESVTFDASTLGKWAIRKPANQITWDGDTTGREHSYGDSIVPYQFDYLVWKVSDDTPAQSSVNGGTITIHHSDGSETIHSMGVSYITSTDKCNGGVYIIKYNSTSATATDAYVLVSTCTNSGYNPIYGGSSVIAPEVGTYFLKRRTSEEYVSNISW